MSRLYDLIQDYRGENPDAIIDIIEKFEPLLGKFQRNGSYEDIKSDLILFMFKLLDNIPLDKEVFKEDKYLVSYIYKPLQNQYIYLNKKNCKIVNKEMVIDEIKLNHSYYDCFNHIIFNDMIKNISFVLGEPEEKEITEDSNDDISYCWANYATDTLMDVSDDYNIVSNADYITLTISKNSEDNTIEFSWTEDVE